MPDWILPLEDEKNIGLGIGNNWQLPLEREKRTQVMANKIAARKERADIRKGTLMAQGIGEFVKSDSFKDYVRKLRWEE